MKLKPGDHVKLTDAATATAWIGLTGEVIEVDVRSNQTYIRPNEDRPDDLGKASFWWPTNYIELIEPADATDEDEILQYMVKLFGDAAVVLGLEDEMTRIAKLAITIMDLKKR